MNCIIVDDDEMARVSLNMLCERIQDLDVLEIFESGIDAMNWLNTNKVDLILLDIEMPDLTGMDLIKSIDNLPQIIFITGHTEYAFEAFEYKVTDFVAKPVNYGRLLKAIERARELNELEGSGEQNEIFVRVDGRYVRLGLDEILYIESLGDYVKFVTAEKAHVVHSTLKNINDKIQNNKFLKTHRSYIVNISKIVDIEENNLVIKDKVIPISRSHRPALMNRIKTL
ncbi:MAG: DNA-binding LytR/AlgR family response regulator [Cyclobacteriaceae bacterium]|jgi:DNA-binding LytR/AlgR family response regulator